MTITLAPWMAPLALTALIVAATFLWPISKGGGDYNFAPAFDALAHAVIGLVALLSVWLIFFAVMWAIS